MFVTDVVDGSVVAAQKEEGACGVVAADWNHVLVLHRNQRRKCWELRPRGHMLLQHICVQRQVSEPNLKLNQLSTCQCLVTAFHTPTFPAWLVAISWLPTKKRASTGTFRLKTPAGHTF